MTEEKGPKLSDSSLRKRKSSAISPTPHPPHTTTIRSLPYTYLQISLVSTLLNPDPLDAVTVRTNLTSALQQFLGVTGTAIPIDILKLDDRDVWIRVPREDGKAVTEAVSGWTSETVKWRVKGKSDWLGWLVAGSGRALFE